MFLFVLGAFIGSFLNVCVYRIPQHDDLKSQLQGLVSPPSSCPRCRYCIRWYDNVPILGWILLNGRCRNCQTPISFRYPFIELLNGLLFVLVFWFEVPTAWTATIRDSLFFNEAFHNDMTDWTRNQQGIHVMLQYAYHLVLIEALLVASLIDLDEMIIPDGSTLPAMAVGLTGAFLSGYFYLVPVWYQDNRLMSEFRWIIPDSYKFLFTDLSISNWMIQWPHLHGLLVSVVGLIVGGGIVWAVRIVGQWILKQEAMGFGDVVLMAMIGSFIGWQAVIMVFFLAPLFALLIVLISFVFHRQREIPYGPYLSIATVVLLLGWKNIWPVAQKIFATGMMIPLFAMISLILLAACLYFLQLIKRMLGIPVGSGEVYIEEWTAADQLFYYSGEQVDSEQGVWKCRRSEQSQFSQSGRGQFFEKQWKHPQE